MCRFLTDAISDVSTQSGLSQAFLGLIILPIAGNACEHITAVLVAYKDKMDLAIGVALGSSIQIAIFVLPVLVLIGYAFRAVPIMQFLLCSAYYAVSSVPACALCPCLWGCACHASEGCAYHASGAVLAMPWGCACHASEAVRTVLSLQFLLVPHIHGSSCLVCWQCSGSQEQACDQCAWTSS